MTTPARGPRRPGVGYRPVVHRIRARAANRLGPQRQGQGRETGCQLPSPDDIAEWVEATGGGQEFIDELTAPAGRGSDLTHRP